MNTQDTIEQKIVEAIPILGLEVINESHMHNVPPGSESHFKVVIVSQEFQGKMPVKRHQLVYALLATELREQIHALALHTYTAEEWRSKGQQAPTTPDCRGGGHK